MGEDAVPGVHPGDHDRGDPNEESWRLRVDGQDFRVRRRAGAARTYDFDWLSGPHPYGFTSSGPFELGVAEMEEAVREFLARSARRPATWTEYVDDEPSTLTCRNCSAQCTDVTGGCGRPWTRR